MMSKSPHRLFKDLILHDVLVQPKEMVGLLLLLNQLICKFSTLVHDILDEVFPAIAGRILSIIPRDAFPSGPGTNTEVWKLCLFLHFYNIIILLELRMIIYLFSLSFFFFFLVGLLCVCYALFG